MDINPPTVKTRSLKAPDITVLLPGFKNYKSFRSKILVPTITILVLLAALLCVYLSVRFTSYCNTLLDAKVHANISALRMYLQEAENHTKVAAVSMAANPEVVRAIKSKDRAKIIEIFSSTLTFYRVTHYTICDSEGFVLARTHEPDQFGDLISYQKNISEALEGRIATLFEYGSVVRVAVRTGVPVYDNNGKLIGIISSGVRFDTDEAVDELSALSHSDVSVILENTRIATTLRHKGQRIIGTKMDPDIAKIVVDSKTEHYGRVDIFGESHVAFYMPVIDSDGKAFASFFIGEPMSGVSAKIGAMVFQGIVIGFIGLILSIGLLTVVITVLSQDIIVLAKDMIGVSQGNLDIMIDINREDEVGRLAKSMRKVVSIIRKLLQDINIMIAEHERGNTEYGLNAEAFQGEFKTLANNILKLSDVGIRDHLTRLPNRRSFDNRFDMEWNHARREKRPISLLLLDLDHFKNYNDAHGHQQGDVALQETANAILRAVRRDVDFVARWGGEEFAVLLPNTDSSGAMTVASNIRAEIERTIIPCSDEGAAKITASIGISTHVPTQVDSVNLLIQRADEALYGAKQSGRNRTEFRP